MLSNTLKKGINALWDKFWSRGISNPITAIEQISYLLFMRRLDVTDQEKKKHADTSKEQYVSIFQENELYRWSQFRNLTPPEILILIREKVFPFIKSLGKFSSHNREIISPYSKAMESAVFVIQNPSLLEEAINIIDDIYDIIDKEKEKGESFNDIQGDMYEYLLSELSQSGKNGQFRTPRHIIKMMCELLDLNPSDKICDPACGTAGFLLAAYQYILTKNTLSSDLKKDPDGFFRGNTGELINKKHTWDKLKENTFFGFDIDQTMVRIALMNLMLHGINSPQIINMDTLSSRYEEYEKDELYTKILANPPFTGKIDAGAKSNKLRISANNTELLFLDRIIRMLAPGGMAAVIIPEGVLFGSTRAQKNIRKILLHDCDFEAVISLPSGVFKPYTGVKTAIIIFTKRKLYSTTPHTSNVWFYELKSDGYSLDDNRKRLKDFPLPQAVDAWKNRKEDFSTARTGKHFWVPIKEILKNDFDLSINRYKEFIFVEKDYPPPSTTIKELIELESEILSDLQILNQITDIPNNEATT